VVAQVGCFHMRTDTGVDGTTGAQNIGRASSHERQEPHTALLGAVCCQSPLANFARSHILGAWCPEGPRCGAEEPVSRGPGPGLCQNFRQQPEPIWLVFNTLAPWAIGQATQPYVTSVLQSSRVTVCPVLPMEATLNPVGRGSGGTQRRRPRGAPVTSHGVTSPGCWDMS
jgi:hypothetical protein